MLSGMSFSHLGYPTNLSLSSLQTPPTTLESSLGPLFPYPVVSNGNPLTPFYSHASAVAAVANATAYKSSGGLFPSNRSGGGSEAGSGPMRMTDNITLTGPGRSSAVIAAHSNNSSAVVDSTIKSESARLLSNSMATGGGPGEYGSGACKLQQGSSSFKAASAGWPRPGPYPCEQSWRSAFYSNSSDSLDLNNARRKNVTRESTATLKSWLQEHIKNPYPTKGEKIMLAIITKMTLTQVSTWFANARRRLKKENKMTWSPRNRADDEDDEDDDDLGDEAENGGQGHGTDVTNLINESASTNALKLMQSNSILGTTSKPCQTFMEDASKPRIWSLAMTATSSSPLSLINNNNSGHSNIAVNQIAAAHGGLQSGPRSSLVQSQPLPFNSLFGALHPTHV